ncbi:hypothetical protein [Cytobacillus sp. IB215665]
MMEWILLLLLLLCPLSMVFMMKGHNHGKHQHGHRHGKHQFGHNATVQSDLSSEEEQSSRLDSYKVKQLEGELTMLREQHELLKEKFDDSIESNAKNK